MIAETLLVFYGILTLLTIRKLVVSYAGQDEEFLQVLRKKLAARLHIVEFFCDLKLPSRNDWDTELEHHFQTADGFVFFMSTDSER